MHLSSEGTDGGVGGGGGSVFNSFHFMWHQLCGREKFPALDQIAIKFLNGLSSLSKTINFY